MLVQNISRGHEILKTFWNFGAPYMAKELREKEMTGSAVTVVIKTADFKQTTRVGNLLMSAADEAAIFESAKWSLLHLLDKTRRGQTMTTLRMMGVRMAKLMENPESEVRSKQED